MKVKWTRMKVPSALDSFLLNSITSIKTAHEIKTMPAPVAMAYSAI